MRYSIFLILFFIFSFLFKTDTAFDQDLGRHIKLGEIILQSESVPKINLFSYTNTDFPFVNTHWLFEIFSYLFVNNLGVNAFLVFKVLILLLACFLTLRLTAPKNIVMLPIAFIFAHVLRERTELRPEIFSFLFTALSLYILSSFLRRQESNQKDQQNRIIFALPFIQLIWINTHIYFFVGLVLQAIFILQLIYNNLRSHLTSGKLKLMGSIFLLSIIFSLMNPNGLAGLLYPLKVTENYGYQIVENQTIFFLESINFQNPNFLFVKISWVIILSALLAGLFKRKITVADLSICLFGFGLSVLNVRGMPYLFFLSIPVVLKVINFVKPNPFLKTLNYLFTIILLVESFFYLNGDYYKYKEQQYKTGLSGQESIKKGMDFVLEKNLPEPIFNNFDIGSYITYRTYPRYKVFVDGRPEAYPASFFTDIYVPMQYDYAKFKNAEKKYGFKTVIFSITDQTPWGQNFLKNVVADPEWKLVYLDDFIIVLVKRESSNNLVQMDLSQLNPADYNFANHRSYLNLSIFLLNTGYLDPAGLFAQSALKLFNKSPIGNRILYSLF